MLLQSLMCTQVKKAKKKKKLVAQRNGAEVFSICLV